VEDGVMKAIVWTKYGPPEGLVLQDVPKPAPRDNQVLIRIHATTVSAGDCELRRAQLPFAYQLPLRLYFGLLRPRNLILGQELAGEIEEVGKDVTLLQPGDQVIAWTTFHFGGYAEYACLAETGMLAKKPPSMTYEEAATLPIGGLEAANFLKRGQIQRGEKVVILGAGGSIGTYAVQLARDLGAHVTGVDSEGKLEMLRSIGADQVLDYSKEDFTKGRETYDVIFDVVGKTSYSPTIRSLTPGGRYLIDNARLSHRVRGQWTSARTRKQVIPWVDRSATEYHADFHFLNQLIEAGKIRAVIDRTYTLEEMVEAHRYVDSGRKKGNVVITVAHDDKA
jgi:NADPH:quinone reductase-like Zn-dependent oxidoreductase